MHVNFKQFLYYTHKKYKIIDVLNCILNFNEFYWKTYMKINFKYLF